MRHGRVKAVARDTAGGGARTADRSGPAAVRVQTGWMGLQRPERIPAERGLSVGPATGAHEAEADAMAERATGATGRGGRSDGMEGNPAPGIVRQVLRSPGHSLDRETRAWMEPRLGSDLSAIRVHTGPEAARSAAAVGARAYTVGRDAVFGTGAFDPTSRDGRRLLAHEMSHAVQQSGGAPGLSSTGPMVAREPDDKPKADPPKADPVADDKDKKTQTIVVSPQDLLLPKVPPAPVAPGAGSGAGAGATPAPNLSPSQVTPQPGPLAPTGTPLPQGPAQQPSAPAAGGAAAPSRLSLADFGVLSLGLRINFPDLPKIGGPDAPPSALDQSLKKGEILNFIINKQPPSEYQLDAGKLVGAAWGIFSTRIAPDVAAKIAAKAGGKPKTGPFSATADATLLISGKGVGGGVSLSFSF
jgi:hypothetical protein